MSRTQVVSPEDALLKEESFGPDAVLIESNININEHRQIRDSYKDELKDEHKEDLIRQADALRGLYHHSTETKLEIVSLCDPTEVIAEMCCSLCSKIVHPPGFFCFDGHLICEKDVTNVRSCPYVSDGSMCNKAFVSARPLFYEFMYRNSYVECGYTDGGCTKLILGREVKNHEFLCDFRGQVAATSLPKTQVENEKSADADVDKIGSQKSDSSSEEFAELTGGEVFRAEQLSEFRFTNEDIEFALKKLMREIPIPEDKWIAHIPSVCRDGISLDEAGREIRRLKFVLKRREEKKKAQL